MRKTFLFACAAIAATLSFTSCSNEVDMFEKAGKTATIDLNITNDLVMVTRASSAVANPSDWYIKVGSEAAFRYSALSGKTFNAGTTTIKVSSHADEAAAMTANAAYYEKEQSETLQKGINQVAIDCGKAKNCRVVADLTGLEEINAITDAKIEVSQNSVDYTLTTGAETRYLYAGKDITYTLKYKYNSADKVVDGTAAISNPTAATEYKITVGSTTNGKITLTISRDEEFDSNNTETITIDAATGEKEQTQNS